MDDELEPCRILARAWRGATLLAESRSTVVRHPPDHAPELLFPRSDVGELDGTRPVAGIELVAFADPAVTIELTETWGDGSTVTTAFPHWGDSTHLIDILDVQPSGPNRYLSLARANHGRPVVEGSQMLGQAIVVALRRAPGRRVTSAHMVFMRMVDGRRSYELGVEELSSGRTFSTFAVTVIQDDRRCAAGIVQVGTTAPDIIRHSVPADPSAGPAASVPLDMGVTGREIRVVDAAYTSDSAAPTGPPVIDAWVRFREVPDDPALHIALLAQFTGAMPIAAALRPHAGIGQDQAHRTISTSPNAITLTAHADARSDQWIRFHHQSTQAGDGMTHAECVAYTEAGDAVASFTVEAMVRPFSARMGVVDPRTAM